MIGIVTALMISLASPAQVASPANHKDLATPTPAIKAKDVSIYFSPNGGCTEAIVGRIKSAKHSIRVMAYSFTSAPIAEAILAAKKRGVVVDIVLDKSQASHQYSAATFLHNQGASPLIDGAHAIHHNKVIVIDERVVVTGSFNFSAAAEKSNAENLIIFGDHKEIAAAYTEEFLKHARHSAQYIGFKQPVVSEKPATTGEATVYVTKTGSKYHRAGCRHAENGSAITRSQAVSRGLEPCGTCKP